MEHEILLSLLGITGDVIYDGESEFKINESANFIENSEKVE